MNAVEGQGGIDKSQFKMSGNSEPEIPILARSSSDSLVKSSYLHQTLLAEEDRRYLDAARPEKLQVTVAKKTLHVP